MYRDLIGPAGYGGTRYFPLFFALIAGITELGLDPIAAGHTVSAAGLGVLVAGTLALLRQFGLPWNAAVAVSLLTTAPYFVQQTTLAIRVDPLAAGLAISGLAAVWAVMQQPDRARRDATIAAVWFTLAIAAKPTTVYAPIAAVLTLLLGGWRGDARRLAALSAAGVVLLVLGLEWLSAGRFLVSLRVTALAGEVPGGLLSSSAVARPLELIATSRLLTVLMLFTAIALLGTRRQGQHLPIVTLGAVAATTTFALATPGTILTNQIGEFYAVAVIFLAWFCHTHDRAARPGAMILAILLGWTAVQNITRMADTLGVQQVDRLPSRRAALVAALRDCRGPVLAESPVVPIFAGESPVLLDPFAFRVVASRMRAMSDDLISRISARQYGCVVVERDPTTQPGANWYRPVHLGSPVLDAILRHYRYRKTVGGQRFYTPETAGEDATRETAHGQRAEPRR